MKIYKFKKLGTLEMKNYLLEKIQYILLLILITTGITMAADNNTTQVKYQLRFKANYIQCIVRINDVFVYDTYDSVGNKNPIQLSFGHDITQFLRQGVNTISIKASNFAKYISIEDISKSYCEVDLIATAKDSNVNSVETKLVSNLRYNYIPNPEDSKLDFSYILSINESNKEIDERLTSPDISLKQDLPYPKRRQDYIQETTAIREFTVNHHQPFSWVNDSTPFEDTPNNKKMLWNKYQEILKAVADKDKKAVRKLVEPGVSDMAKHYGDSNAEGQFEFSFADTFEHYFNLNPDVYEANPLTLDDYDLEIYAEGKLFRLNRKGYTLISPLRWENSVKGTTRVYNPIFTFIDGEIVMAWF